MTHKTRTFTIKDPRTFDGDPFEVAERAVRQAEAITRLAAECTDEASIMARNAQLERNLQETKNDARANEWEDSHQSRLFGTIHKTLKTAEHKLTQLAKAAGYNPKNPPKD
jgi:hypothetical protein